MNINWKHSLIVLVLAGIALPANAATAPKTYTLKSGRTLVAPLIVGRKPNGLEVSHGEGVSFIPFTEMTAKTQKRFHYSAKKSQAFTKREDASKKRQKIRKEKESQALAKRRVHYAELKTAYNIEQLGDEIYQTKERIKFLQEEIPKLEASQEKQMNTVVGMSSESADSAGRNGNNYSNFFGGNNSGNNSDRAERTKRSSINNVADEYMEDKNRLKVYQTDLEHRILSLRKLEREYKKMGGDISKIAAPADTKEDKSFMSPITNLFK